MIDLHCHLLPGVDDGPATIEESLAMARMAYDDGVRAVVVTPHATDWWQICPPEHTAERLQEEVQRLEETFRQAGVSLCLYPGMEVPLEPAIGAWLAEGWAHPLAQGPYVLVELPFSQYPLYADEVLFQMQVAGWRPILAHPERYSYVHRDPQLLLPLVERGSLLQVMASSLTGGAGPAAKRTALWLLERGVVHCLASDGHQASGVRLPLLGPAVEVAGRLVGEEEARRLVTGAPQRILRGEVTSSSASRRLSATSA